MSHFALRVKGGAAVSRLLRNVRRATRNRRPALIAGVSSPGRCQNFGLARAQNSPVDRVFVKGGYQPGQREPLQHAALKTLAAR
jgi:hypothetical protein